MRLVFATLIGISALALASPAAAEPPVRLSIEAVRPSASKHAGVRIAVPLSAAPVLWCISPDDPRCMPVSHDDGPSRSLVSVAPADREPSVPDVLPPDADRLSFVIEIDHPTAGVRSRVERPPRS